MKGRLAALLLAGLVAATAHAQEVVDVPTRSGVTERMLVLRPAQVAATVILLTGGPGRVTIAADGAVSRGAANFLVRSRQLFADQGLAVVVLDAPSDRADLDGAFRASTDHMRDLGMAIRWARARFGRKVWLVGTSRGTQSAAAAGIALQGEDAPDGLVLSSTILGRSHRSPVTVPPVPEMDLARLQMPVLVVHHQQDPCGVTDPARLPLLTAKLPQAQLHTFTGGSSTGPACEPHSHHGFNGIEPQVVADIAAWIRERS